MPCCAMAARTSSGQALHMRRGKEALRVIERKRTFLARQLGAGEIGGPLDGRHPLSASATASGVP